MCEERIAVDVDRLREALVDDAGSAAFAGFPAAMIDVMELEDALPEELLSHAEDVGLDLREFEV